MYNEKLEPILKDIENKDMEIAGGSVIGMVLAEINSLIKFICNLTVGKKKYENVENEVLQLKDIAENLKKETLEIIDKDKEILEEILRAYKFRKENSLKYQEVNKIAVEFCMKVTNKSLETLELAQKVSKVGNKMLSSDFKICAFYAFASVEASIVNVKINLDSIQDEKYQKNIKLECLKIHNKAELVRQEILKDEIV